MELKEYENKAMSTKMDSCDNPLYMLFEISSEAGELHGKFAKAIRKGAIEFDGNNDFRSNMSAEDYAEWFEDVVHELGDILWGIAGLSEAIGTSLEQVAKMNLEKLASRKARGVIEGEGDNR